MLGNDRFCSVCGQEAPIDSVSPVAGAEPSALEAALAKHQRLLDAHAAEFTERRSQRKADAKIDKRDVAHDLAQATKDGANAAGSSAGNLSLTASVGNFMLPIALVATEAASPSLANALDAIRARPRSAKAKHVRASFPCGDCGRSHALVYIDQRLYDPDSGHVVTSFRCPRGEVIHRLPTTTTFRTLRCGETVLARIPDVVQILGGGVLDFSHEHSGT